MLTTSRALCLVLVSTALALPLGPLAPGAEAAGPTCHGLRATEVGTAGKDRIVGTPRRDVIVGLGGDDRIDGRGGNDVICGGDGADVLVGGPGADRVETGRQGRTTTRDGRVAVPDEVEGGPGNDVLVLQADPRPVTGERSTSFSILTYRHSAKGVRVSLGDGRRGSARGAGRDRLLLGGPVLLIGSPHDDRLDGGPGDDQVFGGTGDDVVRGLGGDDDLTGDPFVQPGTPPAADDDQVDGGDGDDLVASHVGADVLHGGAGDDLVDGYADRASQLVGDDGDDSLSTYLLDGLLLDGGPGTDAAYLYRAPDDASPGSDPVVVHRASGTLTRGAVRGRTTGVESYRPEYGLTVQEDPTS